MPESLPAAEQHKLVSQVNEHHVKINQLSEEIKAVNSNVNHVQASVNEVKSNQESMRTFVEMSGKRTEDLIGSLKGELQHSDTQYVRDRSEDAKRPATIRQSVLFQIITLVVTVSGGLFLGFQKGINEVNAISEKRHAEQEKVILREREKSDAALMRWGDFREWKGVTDTERKWDRSDIAAQKQDLLDYAETDRRVTKELCEQMKELISKGQNQ